MSHLPPEPLSEFVVGFGNRLIADDVAGLAAEIAYYFLFALFPFLLFLTSLLAYLPLGESLPRLITAARRLLPEGAFQIVEENFRKIVAEKKGGILSFGIAAALWSSSGGVTAVITALNRAYGVKETRPFLMVQGLALGMVIGLSVFMAAVLVLALFGGPLRSLLERVGMERAGSRLFAILRWPVVCLLALVPVTALLYFGPAAAQPFTAAIPGAAAAVLLWVGGSAVLSLFIDRFGSFDKTYGSIGAVIALLTWLYFSGFVLVAGGEINAMLLR